MDKKVILILIDGMRPDGLKKCGSPYLDGLLKKSSFTFGAKTVFPSVTLPCHMSLFHSVPPERHGTTTNVYAPQVRPISGLFEQIKGAGGTSAMFYGWEPLRSVSRPGSLIKADYINLYSFEHTDRMLTEAALNYVKLASPDFVFLYMGETDDKGGHENGWMSETYHDYIKSAIANVKKVMDETCGEYTVIVTADHGGHDRIHGTTLDEDMTIPMLFCGEDFEAGKELNGVRIIDLAPTIADIMSVPVPREWEGRSILSHNKK